MEINKDLIIEGTNVNLEDLVGIILYTGSTSGTYVSPITLSDSAANYKFFDIYVRDCDGQYSFVKVYEPNQKTFITTCGYVPYYDVKQTTWKISGSRITMVNSYEAYGGDSTTTTTGTWQATSIIMKVIGYK